METVGIRELKAHLSHHLRRVRAGARVVVTERGLAIATIDAVAFPQTIMWARDLVTAGQANWNGGKPEGCHRPPETTDGHPVSAVVIEDRR
jgi:prevent-host-death family protein